MCRETRELERQLRVLQRTSGGTEKQIFALRKTIRHHYRQVIYLDLAFAAENEVEPALWKYVFYKQIEELRKLLRQVSTAQHSTAQHSHALLTRHCPPHTAASPLGPLCVLQFAPSPTSSSSAMGGARPLVVGAGVKEHSDRYARLSTFFRQFLRDSKKFYRSLLNYHLKVAKIHRVGGKFRDLLVKGRRRVVDDEEDVFDDEDEDDEDEADVEDISSSGSGGPSGNLSDHDSGEGHDSNNSNEEAAQHASSSSSFTHGGGATASSSSSFSASSAQSKAYTAAELHTMHLALLTCHRSLIFLGDLERYSQLILGPSPDHPAAAADKDGKDARDLRWSKAERYYRWALTIMACNGNPHNQLAVVATYKQNNLLAVHRYFRSIAVQQPFSTAMQNLKLLFDKQLSLNVILHQQHAQHHPSVQLCCEWYELSMVSMKMVDTFVVHLLDVLYTGRNLDIGVCIIHGVVQRLEHFLLNSNAVMQAAAAAGGVSHAGSLNVYCLQLLLNAIFCVHQHVPSTQIITSDGASSHGAEEEKKEEKAAEGATLAPLLVAGSSSTSSDSAPRGALALPPSFFRDASCGSLSFLFLFDLLRAFMCSMNAVQAQSLHKLGVVAIWCDWLHLNPAFIDPLPIFSSPLSPRSQPNDDAEKPSLTSANAASSSAGSLPSSPFLEHQRLIRTRCWQAFAALCNTLTACMDCTAQDVVDAVGLPDQPPLKEELEVYAFSYLSAAYPSLTHDFYYRRSDPQSLAELTGQGVPKEAQSPPSISASTVVGSSSSSFSGAKISPTTSSRGRERAQAQGGVGLDRKQYRRAAKVLRFTQFLLHGFAVIKQDATTGRYYVDTDLHEPPLVTPAAAPVLRSQQQMAFAQPSLVQPPAVHSAASQGRGSQTSTTLAGGHRGASAASQVRGLMPQSVGPGMGVPSSGRLTGVHGAVAMGGGGLLGMSAHHQPAPGLVYPSQLAAAALRPSMDDYGGGSQRGSLKRGAPLARSALSGVHAGHYEDAPPSWREAPGHHDLSQQPRGVRGSQGAPSAPVPQRSSNDFSMGAYGAGVGAMGDDDLDIDAVLERRMEEEKRTRWSHDRDSDREQAQNHATFDHHPQQSPYVSSHIHGLISHTAPRSSTSNLNLSGTLARAQADGLAINTDLTSTSSSSSRQRPTSGGANFPEPISAGATVGRTPPAGGAADTVSRDHSGSPGAAEFRHFSYSLAPGQSRSSASSSPPLNGRPSDGWDGYGGGGGGGVGGSSLQTASAAAPAEESADPSASRGWTPFDSGTALPFSFLHHSSLFSAGGGSSSSLADYEAQQQSVFEQQRRESSRSNEPGGAEDADRQPSPSSRSPSPALPQHGNASSSPPMSAAQPGYGGGLLQQPGGPPGFRGGSGLLNSNRMAPGRGADGGMGFGSSASSVGALRDGSSGGGGLLRSGAVAAQQSQGGSSAWAASVGQGLSDAYARSLHFPSASVARGRDAADDARHMDAGGAERWPSSARDERHRIEDDMGLDDLLSDDQDVADLQRFPQSHSQAYGHQQQQQQQQQRRPHHSAATGARPGGGGAATVGGGGVYRPPHLQHRENAQPQPYDAYGGDAPKGAVGHRSATSYPSPAAAHGGGGPSSSSSSPRFSYPSSAGAAQAQQQQPQRFSVVGALSSAAFSAASSSQRGQLK